MNDDFTGSLIIYQTEDGRSQVECRLVDETISLSQAIMGELFDRSKQTISEHLQNLFSETELDEKAVVRSFRTTAADGKYKSPTAQRPSKAPTGRQYNSPGHRPGFIAPKKSGSLKGRNMGGGK